MNICVTEVPITFCKGCPKIPEGAYAQLTSVTNVTEAEMRRYRIGRDAPDLLRDLGVIDGARITAVVLSSENPSVEVGDEAQSIVLRQGRTDEEVVMAVRDCPGANRTRTDKLLGRPGVCGALRDLTQRR